MGDSNDQHSQAQQQQQPIVSPFLPYDTEHHTSQVDPGSPLEPFPPFPQNALQHSPSRRRFSYQAHPYSQEGGHEGADFDHLSQSNFPANSRDPNSDHLSRKWDDTIRGSLSSSMTQNINIDQSRGSRVPKEFPFLGPLPGNRQNSKASQDVISVGTSQSQAKEGSFEVSQNIFRNSTFDSRRVQDREEMWNTRNQGITSHEDLTKLYSTLEPIGPPKKLRPKLHETISLNDLGIAKSSKVPKTNTDLIERSSKLKFATPGDDDIGDSSKLFTSSRSSTALATILHGKDTSPLKGFEQNTLKRNESFSTLKTTLNTSMGDQWGTRKEGLYDNSGTMNALYGTPINQGKALNEPVGMNAGSFGTRESGMQSQAARVKNVLDDVFDNVGRQGNKTTPEMTIGSGQGSLTKRFGEGTAQGGQNGNEIGVAVANRSSDAQTQGETQNASPQQSSDRSITPTMPPNLKKIIVDNSSDKETDNGAKALDSATSGPGSHANKSSAQGSVPHTPYMIPDGFQPVVGQFYIFIRDENGTPRLTECYMNSTESLANARNINLERQTASERKNLTESTVSADGPRDMNLARQTGSEHQTLQGQHLKGLPPKPEAPLQGTSQHISRGVRVRQNDGQNQVTQDHTLSQVDWLSSSDNKPRRQRFQTNPWANFPPNFPMMSYGPYSAFIPSVNGPIPLPPPPGYTTSSPYNPDPPLQDVYAPTPVRPDPLGHTMNPRIAPFTPLMQAAFTSPNTDPSQTAYMAYPNNQNIPLSNIVNVRTRAESPMAPVPGSMRSTPSLAPSFAGSSGPMTFNSEMGNRYVPSRQANFPVLAPLPYRPGSDAMYPQPMVEGMSVRLQEMQRAGQPDVSTMMSQQFLPFAENARQTRPDEWGVMKLKNIPYAVTRQEVLALLGRNAKIITPDLGFPIHITMERSTGKTMDCYIEFFSHGDACATMNRIQRDKGLDHHSVKLGGRTAEVELSTQGALMKALFPKAKNVTWHGQVPEIRPETDPYLTGFIGFLTNEELVMMVKYAEQPQRHGFCQKSLSRTYECMISTLSKFPWFETEFYTILQRDHIFDAACKQITYLTNAVKNTGAPGLTVTLLQELLFAALNVPVFSEIQRLNLIASAGQAGQQIATSPLMVAWPFEVLGRKQDWDEDVVAYYAILMAKVTRTSDSPARAYDNPFGDIKNKVTSDMTLAQAGATEMQYLEEILSLVR